jgi:autophagy-related protein 5
LYANDYNENSSNTPWCLNVHFEQFPDELMHCNTKDIVESYFLSTIKEADALKHKGKVRHSK